MEYIAIIQSLLGSATDRVKDPKMKSNYNVVNINNNMYIALTL